MLHTVVLPPQSPSVLQPQPPGTVAMHARLLVFAEQSTKGPPEAHTWAPLQICAGANPVPMHEAARQALVLVEVHWTQF